MVHYIFQIMVFQLVFLLIYEILLKKETFFNWNRAYLLITALLSFVIPFIKWQSIKNIIPQNFVVRLPEVILGEEEPNVNVVESVVKSTQNVYAEVFSWSWMDVFYLGAVIALTFLFVKLVKLLLLIIKSPKRWKGDILVVNLSNSNSAFSFFHYIFLGENLTETEKKSIITHELIHVKQKHTLDLLFFELLKVVFWFNPIIYIYQKRIADLHEFIADKKTQETQGKSTYYQNLLSQVFDVQNISFINSFYKKSLIKKRIVMLQKSKSSKVKLLKYALILPMVFGMLVFTSAYAQNNKPSKTTQDETIYQDLSDEELIQKFYNEIVETEKKGNDFFDDFNDYIPSFEKYINTRIEYAKSRALMMYLFDIMNEKKKSNGNLTDEDIERQKRFLSEHKTYQDYLDWKKTDEAKEEWESNIRDGVLRLVVGDLKSLTEAEKIKGDKKTQMILNDDYFHALLITDGKQSTKLQFDDDKIPHIEVENLGSSNEDIEVPFSVIEEPPVFPGCETLTSNGERKKCFSEKVSKHVNDNFNTNMAKALGLKGRQRIMVFFRIGKNGNIKDIKARAPHPDLEREAIRVVKSLPQVKPGKQKGENVMVPYALPILFQVSE